MESHHYYVQGIWDVQHLLKEWKLENIWPHLLAQKIDGEILQMIKIPHIRMLLGNFPLGIQIRFEHNLEQWRYNIGRPLQQSRCDGNCEFSSYKPSSHANHNLLSNGISKLGIPTGGEFYTEPKQNNHLQPDTIVTRRTQIQAYKDSILTNNHTPPETPITRSQASTPSAKNDTTAPYTTKPQGPVPKVKLREILIKCKPEGPQLLQIYKHRNTFTRPERRRLVSLLVHYYLRNDLKFCLQTSYALERAILKMFPGERLDMYRRAKRGSIYCKYMSVKPLYNKKLGESNPMRHRNLNKNEDAGDKSDLETGCFSDENSSLRGVGGIRNSSGCYSINEDDYATVSNMAHDDEDDADGDPIGSGKSEYTFSYVQERDVKDVKPTIIEDSEISIQTAYNLHREVITVSKPVLYENFLNKACTVLNINNKENLYMTVNDCEIDKDEINSVVRQYSKLPAFVVELKQKNLFINQSDQNNNQIMHDPTEDDDDPVNTIPVTTLPNANDIRNLPPLRHIVWLSNASQPLENKHRTYIAKAVIDECLSLQPDRSLKRQEYLILAQRICEAFPGEEEITYYVPSQPNHPARGKLWCYFKNKRHFLSTVGVLKTRSIKRRNKSQCCQDENENSLNKKEEEDICSTLERELIEFGENSSINLETIKTKWRATHTERRQSLLHVKLTPSEYMEKYAILKTLHGISLIEIDLQLLYPQMSNVDKWITIYPKVLKKLSSKRMPDNVKKWMKIIKQSENEKYKASLALLLLPYLFPYKGCPSELAGCAKVKKLEIQQRFIKEFPSIDDLRSEPKLVDLQLRFVHTDQGIVYAEFSIYGFIFKCYDLLEALSCLFCYMTAIKIDYPNLCNHIWQFVQCAIFSIELTGVKSTIVESELSDLIEL